MAKKTSSVSASVYSAFSNETTPSTMRFLLDNRTKILGISVVEHWDEKVGAYLVTRTDDNRYFQAKFAVAVDLWNWLKKFSSKLEGKPCLWFGCPVQIGPKMQRPEDIEQEVANG